MSLLEHEDDGPERRAHGKQVEGDRLHGHEHGAEAHHEGDERARDHEQHHHRRPSGHGILVVRVEPGQSPDAQPRASDAGEGGGVLSAQLAHQARQLGRFHVAARDDLEEGGVALAAHEGVLEERGKEGHIGQIVAALARGRPQPEHARDPLVRGQRVRESPRGRPAGGADGGDVFRQLQDHAHALGHSTPSHRAQVAQRARGLHGRQPVPTRQLRAQPTSLHGERDHGGSRDEEDPAGVCGHPGSPALPSASTACRTRGEEPARVHARAQAGEKRGEERGGDQDRRRDGEEAAHGDGTELAQGHEEQTQEPDRHRRAREGDGAPSVLGRLRGRRVRAQSTLPRLAEAAQGEQGVVDAQAEPEHRHHALQADRERPDARDQGSRAQRQHDRERTGGDGQQGGHHCAEGQEEEDEGDGRGPTFARPDLVRSGAS